MYYKLTFLINATRKLNLKHIIINELRDTTSLNLLLTTDLG